jgi:hypothetical protein
MKTIRTQLVFAGALLLFALIMNVGFAQTPPTPPGPPEHGEGGNQGAPIDGGLGIALAMVAGYGAWKLLKKKKE